MEDADLNLAVPGVVRSSFLNSGQICLCGSRVLIHDSIYDDFMDAYLQQVQDFKIRPAISNQHLEKVLSYIELAKDEGGEILFGGNAIDKPGAWIQPTVVGNISHMSRTATEEIFGPVVTDSSIQNRCGGDFYC